ncbi:MAG TPA: DUF4367 domain-containing protein [Candidatus Methanoperedens sp.]
MRKSILIGISIVTVLGILLVAVTLGFGDTDTKFNAFADAQVHAKVTEQTPPQVQVDNEISEISMEGAIQQAQSNVSFRILKPMYIPSDYKFDSVTGARFKGAMNDIDVSSFSYKNGDEAFTIKEIIMVTRNSTAPSSIPDDTREIVSINGIEGRYSLENGIKLLSWKIGNLSLSIKSWKNEGQNQTDSSLSKEEMIKIAESVREKTPDEAIAEAQDKVSFKILQPAYIPAGYRMNTWQTSGTKFRGTSLEAEQVMIPYIKGDEFFEKNEHLDLKELLIIKDDNNDSESVDKTPYKFIDINGVQGRFLEETSGMKTLEWKVGNLSLTISSYAYKENNITSTSITPEEMAKMARSVK